MTFQINNTEASYEILETGKLEITLAGKKLGKFDAEQLTSLITISLAARKAGYESKRASKTASREAAKASRDAAKAERAAAQLEAKKAQIAKLEAQLAELAPSVA